MELRGGNSGSADDEKKVEEGERYKKVEAMAKLKSVELGVGNFGSFDEEKRVEEGERCEKVEEMAKLKAMELGDGNFASSNEEKTVEEGERCEKVEEMANVNSMELGNRNSGSANEEKKVEDIAKLDESVKTNGVCPDQAEEKKVEEGERCEKVEDMAKFEESIETNGVCQDHAEDKEVEDIAKFEKNVETNGVHPDQAEEKKVEEGERCEKVEDIAKLEESVETNGVLTDQAEEKKVEEGESCEKVEDMAKLEESVKTNQAEEKKVEEGERCEKVEEGERCEEVEEMDKLKEQNIKTNRASPDQAECEKVEEGERCDKVEEMAKLKEENVKTNEAHPDQAEKTKGKGLKKWKRRRRETNKDARHVQEPQRMLHKRVNPHAGRLDTSKGTSGGNKQKNEVFESETSVGNNIVASSSILGFTYPDRESDSGSWNAAVNEFPIGYGEDQSCNSFPKGMAENLATEELLNAFEFGLFENREEINYPPLYGDGIELPIGLMAFGSGDRKRPAGPTKKARAEKFEESNLNSEDPLLECDESSIGAGRVVHKCEEIFGNHIEDFPTTCILSSDKQENLDDLGESSCSTANNLEISAVSASGHSNAVMAKSSSSLIGGNKQENLDDLGESSCSTANNLGSSAISASGHGKMVMAKCGSNASVGNGKWITEEFRLWHENFDPENSRFEGQNSEEAYIFKSQERLIVSHDRYREAEDIRENPVLICDVVSHSEESFTSAATVAAKKREKKGDSQAHVKSTHPQPGESDCMVQALTQLKTAEEALQQEVQQLKDLGKQIEGCQMDSEHGICSESDSVSKHLHKYDAPDGPNGSHVEGKAEIEWPSAGSQLNKWNEKLKLLQKELEAANEKTLSEQKNMQELEVQCKEQEIKLKETKLPSEGSPSELQLLQEKCKEMERELEEQYKEKMQAEIELLMLNNAAKRSIVLVENETSLLQEQKTLVIKQLQTALKLKHAEGRALSLKDQLIELENACGRLLEMEEVLTLHNKVCRSSLFSFIQFILFCVAVLVMFAQSPYASNLVPT